MCTKLTLLLLLNIVALQLTAQSSSGITISGSVTDSLTQNPVGFVTATLSAGGKKISAVTTDSTGAFTLNQLSPGSYSLELSYVGYHSKTIQLTLLAEKPLVSLGSIKLAPDNHQLGNVTVTAQKALVEDKGDRLVYNAERDISNAGGTAADVLRKVPSLTVDLDGNVQLRGNSNIKVLVNGKPSALMARNLADALRQMPAHLIKSVEVITSPGAKYDAEGAAGVINIITKKGLQGFNGSVNAAVGNLNRSIGTNLNLKKKKIGLSLSANAYQYRNIFNSSSERTSLQNSVPLNRLYQNSEGHNTGTGAYGEMSFDYDPDSTTHLNFEANVWGGNFPNNSSVTNKLTDPAGAPLQAFRNESHFKNPYGNGQLDLGYTKSFKKTDQEFSLLGQFSRMPDNYFYNTDRFAPDDEIIYREQSTNYSRNKEYTIQSDYTHPFIINGRKDTTTIKLQVGAKSIIRDIGSEVRVERSLDGKEALTPDPSQSNDFVYTQKVYSGYTSLQISDKHKWNLTAGARLEHTDIQGDFLSTTTHLNSAYHNLIPSFLLSKGIGMNTIKISYTQRITRPLIWYLNPWLNRSDPKNVYTGNPNLHPEINHATELSHSISTTKGLSINTALYWRLTNSAIEYITRVDTGGVSLSRPENIAQRKIYGINTNVSSKPNKNWNLSGGADVRYMDLYSPALQQRNHGVTWNVNINSLYTLPKDYTVQAYASFNSGWLNLQRKGSRSYWYGFSAKHQFWDKKASLTLGVNNPFSRGITQRNRQIAPSFESESRYLYVNRSVRLSFEWRFGQLSAEGGKQGKKISNDDSGR